jgi:uncharacterized phiE125 gp8 family phage protein
MSIKRTTDRTSEPLTLTEVKDFLRVKHTAEDGLIESMIAVAADTCERYLGQSLLPQSWTVRAKQWFSYLEPLELPYPPFRSVTSVKYIDKDGTEQTLATANYFVSEDGMIYLAYDYDQPDLHKDTAEPVIIEYSAGYDDASAIPDSLKHWMKMLIGTTYLYREEITPMQTHTDGIKEIMNRIQSNHRQLRF